MSPLPNQVYLMKYPTLQKLELANYSNSISHDVIDVLVGSDYYWSIVNGEVMKVKGGLMAVNSKMGWLLSGPAEEILHTNLIISTSDASLLLELKMTSYMLC